LQAIYSSDSDKVEVLSVQQLNGYIKSRLERDPNLQHIQVKGEVGPKIAGSNHKYFELLDNTPGKSPSSINCVIWQSNLPKCSKVLQPGKVFILTAKINFYAQRGTVSLSVLSVMEEGDGNREQQLREIRERLKKEGFTDPSRKKNLPFIPSRLAVITAESGAALQDVIRQIKNRFPRLSFLLIPATMQGDMATGSLLDALELAQDPQYKCDLILLTRGGGSPEDLHVFNNEDLARAIALSKVPVVTAIGHEIDHPVVDDTSDKAYPTPTAAAQGIIADINQLLFQIDDSMQRMTESLDRKLNVAKEHYFRLIEFSHVLNDPARIIYDKKEQLEQLRHRMLDSAQDTFAKARECYERIPELNPLIKAFLNNKKHSLELASQQARAYSPLATLDRGYSLLEKGGKVIARGADFNEGSEATLRFSDQKVKVKRV
jgi:exodeoxyribonuclease VII large subunit